MMNFGTGFIDHASLPAFKAGVEVAQQALGGVQKDGVALGLLFCGNQYDVEELIEGVRSILGQDLPVVGGVTIGVITNHNLSYSNRHVALALFESGMGPYEIAAAQGVDENGFKAGELLAQQLNMHAQNDLLFLLYDSVRQEPSENRPWILNSATPILKGLESKASQVPQVVGAGLIGSLAFSATRIFSGHAIEDQVAVGVKLPTGGKHFTRIMHGCTPLDGVYYSVTKMDGPNLYELDGRPIVEVIDEMYGDTSWQDQEPVVNLLAVGINCGERFAETDEKDFVTRLIIGVLPDQQGITVFEPDIAEGDEILFMLRDTTSMIDSARNNARGIMKEVDEAGLKAQYALYIDCGGRTAAFSDTLTEEAAEVQAVVNEYNVPLFGFYSGVEIAPFQNQNRGLDWTGLLVVIAE